MIREVLSAWTPHGFTLDIAAGSQLVRDPDRGLVLTLTADLVPTDGSGQRGILERRLLVGQGIARHLKFELPEAAQRQEKGRHMLGASVRTYEVLGLDRIALAAVDVGRYVWAVCGFSFASEADRQHVAAYLLELESERGVPTAGFDWGSFQPFDVAYAESQRPITRREWLELLEEPVDEEDEDLDELVLRPRKLVLLGAPSWDGSLRIGLGRDGLGYELMRNYTGLSP